MRRPMTLYIPSDIRRRFNFQHFKFRLTQAFVFQQVGGSSAPQRNRVGSPPLISTPTVALGTTWSWVPPKQGKVSPFAHFQPHKSTTLCTVTHWHTCYSAGPQLPLFDQQQSGENFAPSRRSQPVLTAQAQLLWRPLSVCLPLQAYFSVDAYVGKQQEVPGETKPQCMKGCTVQ